MPKIPAESSQTLKANLYKTQMELSLASTLDDDDSSNMVMINRLNMVLERIESVADALYMLGPGQGDVVIELKKHTYSNLLNQILTDVLIANEIISLYLEASKSEETAQ